MNRQDLTRRATDIARNIFAVLDDIGHFDHRVDDETHPVIRGNTIFVRVQFWVRDVAELEPHKRAYVDIAETWRAGDKVPCEYWYGLIDKRGDQELYDGFHLHADPPKWPDRIAHMKATVDGELTQWKPTPGEEMPLPTAVRRLLAIYQLR